MIILTDFSHPLLVVGILCVVLAYLFAIGKTWLKEKARRVYCKYIALCVSKILLTGNDIFWDDLANLYKVKSKSMLGSEESPMYDEGRIILLIAEGFLSKNFPLESIIWARLIRNARRSIPVGAYGDPSIGTPLGTGHEVKEDIGIFRYLIPGVVAIFLIQVALSLSLWIAISLTIIITLVPCLYFGVVYVKLIGLAFNLPKTIKQLEFDFGVLLPKIRI